MAEKQHQYAAASHFDLIYGESLLPILQSLPKTTGSSKTTAAAASTSSTAGQNKVRDKPIRRPDTHQLSSKSKQHGNTGKSAAEEEKKSGNEEGQQLPSNLYNKRKKKTLRKGGQSVWVDETLEEWAENDYRIFCGNMGNEVNDEVLTNAFKKYESFSKAKVIRDKKTMKSKGFGFVSILKVDDYIKAMREMQGKYVGNRPITLKRSDWQKKAALK